MPPPAEGFASRFLLGPALRTQPDRRLVALVREGYGTAFEEIVRRYGRPLGRYAASIVGGRSEDVLQDAFAKALPALRRDGAEIDVRPWLFRIVRNTALNDLRDNPPSPELLAEALTGGSNPAEELERREDLADLIRRLRALPEAQRAAIVMRELEGLGHDEIAAALGLTDGGARQAIYRARRALRDGAGLLLPLPLLRLLIDHGAEAAGASAGAGGALAAAGAGAGGAGGAAKLGVVAVVLAGSLGAGVAVQERGERADHARANPAPRSSAPSATPPRQSSHLAAVPEASERATHGEDRRGPGGGEDNGSRSSGRNEIERSERRGVPGSPHGGRPDRGRRHGHRPDRDRRRSGRPGDDSGRHGGEPGPRRSSGHSRPGGADDGDAREDRHREGPGSSVDGPRPGDDSGRDGGSGPEGGDPPPPPPPSEEEGGSRSGDSGDAGDLSGAGTGDPSRSGSDEGN